NLGLRCKDEKGSYFKRGIIKSVCGDGSFLVKLDDGRIKKMRYYDLKKIFVYEWTPS
ncbi:hypothetical protein COBT_003833, partial [Conglomerata obtusa]